MSLGPHPGLPSSVAAALRQLQSGAVGLDREDWPYHLGRVWELGQSAAERRRGGVHYTPPELAAQVVSMTLTPLTRGEDGRVRRPEQIAGLRVLDPAMGAGVFLVEVLRFLRSELAAAREEHGGIVADDALSGCVFGLDVDGASVAVARLCVGMELGGARLGDSLICGDALTGATPAAAAGYEVAVARVGDGAPVQWEQAFPSVMERGGFDAVLGNPPFKNAIGKATARSKDRKRLYRLLYPVFARGAYDMSLLFWARATRHLLRGGGRYGFVAPVSVLSSEAPWQRWMHASWRPDAIALLGAEAFPEARVRTCVVSGREGVSGWLTVWSEGEHERRRWPESGTWFGATRADRVVVRRAAVALGELVHVHAGCATGVAYELAEVVVDEESGEGAKLVTTGAIDRYRCKWGQMTVRFLKRDYAHPRWPADGEGGVARALERQRGPKVLVGGLTSVIEAWMDARGEAGGVVQTWALVGEPVRLWALLAVLNSAVFSALFVQEHGGAAMSGRQVTVKKSALLGMPVPVALQDADVEAELAGLARRAQGGDDVDRLVHRRVAALYGLDESEEARVWAWWRERAWGPGIRTKRLVLPPGVGA